MLNFPPSEKLSGVKFSTPNIFGNFLKLKLEKFFFFDLIFIISKFIFFFIFSGKYLILLTGIFFFEFLVIISI